MANTRFQLVALKVIELGCRAGVWISIGLGLLGGYILVAQVVLWMKSGHWVEMPLLYLFVEPWAEILSKVPLSEIAPDVGLFSNPFVVLGVEKLVVPPYGVYWETYKYFGAFSQWLANPQSWLGLHKIVRGIFEFVPVSVCFIGLAIATGWNCNAYSKSFQDKIEKLLEQET